MIDSHSHLQFPQFDDEREDIIRECTERGIGLVNVGCEMESSQAAITLAEKNSSHEMWATVGQHPTDTGLPFSYDAFLQLARSSKKVVGIGECGLDYFHLPKDPIEHDRLKGVQKDLFYQHLNLAHELHLPLVIHCRDAHEDMNEILIDRYTTSGIHAVPQGREHGVMHCFTGTWPQAQAYLDLGFYISLTGVITFTDQYDEIVRTIPLEKLLIETDSPFLAPVPHRGKKNRPPYVRFVAEKIARLKNLSLEDVSKITRENTKRLFRIQ